MCNIFLSTFCITDIENKLAPLEAVLQGSETESAMAVMIERLNVSERIIHMSSASVVSPGMEQRGEILISRTAMYFVGEQVTIDMNQVLPLYMFVVLLLVHIFYSFLLLLFCVLYFCCR